MREGDFYTSIGDGHTIAILLALKDAEEQVIMKNLIPVVNHNQSLRYRLDRMEEEGLINMLLVREPRKQVRIWLTDMGRDIAIMFGMVNTLVSPDKDLRDKSIDLILSDPIFRMLNGKEYVVQKDLVGMFRSYATVTKVLSRMEEDGLVVREENNDSYREIRYSLTALGSQVAEVYQNVFEKIDMVRRLPAID